MKIMHSISQSIVDASRLDLSSPAQAIHPVVFDESNREASTIEFIPIFFFAPIRVSSRFIFIEGENLKSSTSTFFKNFLTLPLKVW
jgi:hypothetical protein